MRLFRRSRSAAASEAAHALAETSYDAQADLALPSEESETSPADGFVPFAGQLAPFETGPAYDAARDTGIDPTG